MKERLPILLIKYMLSNRLVQFIAALMIALMTLAGCTNTSNAIERGSFCVLYEPVYYDPIHDTKETIYSLMKNNAVWLKGCYKDERLHVYGR